MDYENLRAKYTTDEIRAFYARAENGDIDDDFYSWLHEIECFDRSRALQEMQSLVASYPWLKKIVQNESLPKIIRDSVLIFFEDGRHYLKHRNRANESSWSMTCYQSRFY